jgi:hypothetical protein
MARSSNRFLLKEAGFQETGTPVRFAAQGKRLRWRRPAAELRPLV